ncbi:hypothetical protein BB561_005475 [Smittium simulii]|uniref:Uncharacterized protein n=1 Tax=Smittium simulii TaxID=133385 RepID=A0A2T9YA72_9FUNG|nr:hypothetical protein BB561_005475 [Smittium simulii]
MFSRKKSSGKNDKKLPDKSSSLSKKSFSSADNALVSPSMTDKNINTSTPEVIPSDLYSGLPYSQNSFSAQPQVVPFTSQNENTLDHQSVDSYSSHSNDIPLSEKIDPKLYNLWFDSIIYGDLQNVKLLLDQVHNILFLQRWEETPYHEALSSIASEALGSDTVGMDGLQVAIIVYKNSHADWRLGRGISNDGQPLSSAQMEKIVSIREDILEQILDSIQTIHLNDNKFGAYKNSSIHLAAFFNDINLVSRLLAHGAKPDAMNLLNYTPIMITTDLNVQTLLIQHQRFLEYEKNLSSGLKSKDHFDSSFGDIDSSANSSADTDYSQLDLHRSSFSSGDISSAYQNGISNEEQDPGYRSFLFRRLSTVQEERDEDIVSFESDKKSLRNSVNFGESVSSFVGIPIEENENFRPDLVKKGRPTLPNQFSSHNISSTQLNSFHSLESAKPNYSSNSKLEPIKEEAAKTSHKSFITNENLNDLAKNNHKSYLNENNISKTVPENTDNTMHIQKNESFENNNNSSSNNMIQHNVSEPKSNPLNITTNKNSSNKPKLEKFLKTTEDWKQYTNINLSAENSSGMKLDSKTLGDLDVEQIFFESDSVNSSMLLLGSKESSIEEKINSDEFFLQANKVSLPSSILHKSTLIKSHNLSLAELGSKIISSTENSSSDRAFQSSHDLNEFLSSKSNGSSNSVRYNSLADSTKSTSSSDLHEIVECLEIKLFEKNTVSLKPTTSQKKSTPFSSDLYNIIMGSKSKPLGSSTSSTKKNNDEKKEKNSEYNSKIPRFLFNDSKIDRNNLGINKSIEPNNPKNNDSAKISIIDSQLNDSISYTDNTSNLKTSSSIGKNQPKKSSSYENISNNNSKNDTVDPHVVKINIPDKKHLELDSVLVTNNEEKQQDHIDHENALKKSTHLQKTSEPYNYSKNSAVLNILQKSKTSGKTSVGLSEDFAYNLELESSQSSINRRPKVSLVNIDGEINVSKTADISSHEEISSCGSSYSRGRLSQKRKKSKQVRKSEEVFRNDLYMKSSQRLQIAQKYSKPHGETDLLSGNETSGSDDEGSFISKISKYSNKLSNNSRRSVSCSGSKSSIKKADFFNNENSNMEKSINNTPLKGPDPYKPKGPKYNLKNNLSIATNSNSKTRRNSSLPERDSIGLFSSAIYSPSFNSHINSFKSTESFHFGEKSRKSSSGSQFDLMNFLYSNTSINTNTTSLISSALPPENISSNASNLLINPDSPIIQNSQSPNAFSIKTNSPKLPSYSAHENSVIQNLPHLPVSNQLNSPIPKLSELAEAELKIIQDSQPVSSDSNNVLPFRLSTPVFKTTESIKQSNSPNNADSGYESVGNASIKANSSTESAQKIVKNKNSKNSLNSINDYIAGNAVSTSNKIYKIEAPKNYKKPPVKLYKAKLMTKSSVEKNINKSIEKLEQKLNSETQSSSTSRRESNTLNKIRDSGIVRGRLELFTSSSSSINTVKASYSLLNASKKSFESKDSEDKMVDPIYSNENKEKNLQNNKALSKAEDKDLLSKIDSLKYLQNSLNTQPTAITNKDIIMHPNSDINHNISYRQTNSNSRPNQMVRPPSFIVVNESDGASSIMRQGRDYTSGDSRIISSSGQLGGINSDSNLDGMQSDLSFRANVSTLSLNTRASIAAQFFLNPVYDSSSLSSYPGEKNIQNKNDFHNNFFKLVGKGDFSNRINETNVNLKNIESNPISTDEISTSQNNDSSIKSYNVADFNRSDINNILNSINLNDTVSSDPRSEYYSEITNDTNISAFPETRFDHIEQQPSIYAKDLNEPSQISKENNTQANEKSILLQLYDIKADKVELMEMITDLNPNSNINYLKSLERTSSLNSSTGDGLTTFHDNYSSDGKPSRISEEYTSRDMNTYSDTRLSKPLDQNSPEVVETKKNSDQDSVYSSSYQSLSSRNSNLSKKSSDNKLQHSKDFSAVQRLNELYISYSASQSLIYKQNMTDKRIPNEISEPKNCDENNEILFIDDKTIDSITYPKLVVSKDGSVLRKSFLDYTSQTESSYKPNSSKPLTTAMGNNKINARSFLEEVDNAIQKKFENKKTEDIDINDYKKLSISSKRIITSSVNEDPDRKIIHRSNSNELALASNSLPWFITPLNGSVVSNFFLLPSPKLQPGYLYLKILSLEDLIDLRQFSSFYSNTKSKNKKEDSLKLAIIIRNGLDTKHSIPIKINPDGKMQVNQEFIILTDPLKPITLWLRVQYSLNNGDAPKSQLQKPKPKNIFNNLKAYDCKKYDLSSNCNLKPKNLFKKINQNLIKRIKSGDFFCWPLAKTDVNTRSSRLKSTNGKRNPLNGMFNSDIRNSEIAKNNIDLKPPVLPYIDNRRHSAPQLSSYDLINSHSSTSKNIKAKAANIPNIINSNFTNVAGNIESIESPLIYHNYKSINTIRPTEIIDEDIELTTPQLRINEDRGYSSEVEFNELTKTIGKSKAKPNINTKPNISSKRYSGISGPTIYTPKELYEDDKKTKLFKKAENNFFLNQSSLEQQVEHNTLELSKYTNFGYGVFPGNTSALSYNMSQETFSSNIESETLGCAAINVAEMLDEVYLKTLIDSWDVVSAWEPKIVCRLQLQMFYIPISQPVESLNSNNEFDLKYINYPILANNLPKNITYCQNAISIAEWHNRTWSSGFLSQLGGDCLYWRRRYYRLIGGFLVAYKVENLHDPSEDNISMENDKKKIDTKFDNEIYKKADAKNSITEWQSQKN